MAKRKDSQKKVDENKVELAKTIAEQSKKIAKSYATIESTILKAFRWFSGWFDKLLFNQRYASVVTLLMAIVLYIAVNSVNSLSIMNAASSAKTFEDLPLTTEVNTSVYEVSGLPETVTLNIIGDASEITLASAENQQVVADLTGLGEGIHQVELKAVGLSSRVRSVIEPSTVTVTISKKISREFTIGYDFINTNRMDQINSLGIPEFETDSVIVRASEQTLNSIASVKALIDVTNVEGDFTIEAPLAAYNQQGDRINVDIVPERVVVTVGVTQPSKDVPINVIPYETIPNNRAIASYSIDHSAVTIWGSQEVLDQINSIDVRIPVGRFTQDVNTVVMPINLPSGVRKASVQSVSITMTLGDMEEKTIEDVLISYRNNTNEYRITIDESELNNIDVLVQGAAEMLEEEDGSGISVYIDLTEIPEGSSGTIDMPLHVEGPNPMLQYSIDRATVKINVTR